MKGLRQSMRAGAALVLVACNGLIGLTEPRLRSIGAPHFASGTRLRARYQDAGGGALAFVGWHDTAVGEDCAFLPTGVGAFVLARDGVLRCLPVSTNRPSPIAFGDDACSVRVVSFADPTRDIPLHILGPTQNTSCASGVSVSAPVFAVGPPAGLLENTPIYSIQGSRCTAIGVAGSGAFRLVGPEVDPKTFAAATDVDEPRNGRFSVRYHATDDGAREAYAITDTTRGERCADTFTYTAKRCYPAQPAYRFESFSDPGCTTHALFRDSDDGCDAPKSASTVSSDCAVPAFVEVGQPLPQVFTGAPGNCTTGTLDPNFVRMWSAGPPIPDDAFAPIEHLQIGAGRLTRTLIATPDGTPLLPSDTTPFYDAVQKTFCRPDGATDLRCIPSITAAYVDTTLFSDAQCTAQRVATYYPSCGDTAPPPIAIETRDTGEEYFAIGAPLAGVFARINGACLAMPPAPTPTYFALGAPIDRTTFPPLTVVTE